MTAQQEIETVVVGAGPSGLAVGACLRQAGRPFVILEREPQVAPAWHRHYDRLHLHTDKRNSGLPFQPWPATAPRYPSRAQVVDYLEEYRRSQGLEPRLGQEVRAIRPADGGWDVQTADTTYRARWVVIATGFNGAPVRPAFPGVEQYGGTLLHSSEYRNGEAFRGKQVLVIGFGNSGGELAIDLHEHGAAPTLAVRGPINVVPREILGIPILSLALVVDRLPTRIADALSWPLARLSLGDLTKLGLQRPKMGMLEQVVTRRRVPLIDVGTIGLIRSGAVKVRPGVEAFTAQGVRFTDGTEGAFDAVILATGFRPKLEAFLDVPAAVGSDGVPLQSGREAQPGLFFCGFYVAPTGMLREIGIEARRIARAISQSGMSDGRQGTSVDSAP